MDFKKFKWTNKWYSLATHNFKSNCAHNKLYTWYDFIILHCFWCYLRNGDNIRFSKVFNSWKSSIMIVYDNLSNAFYNFFKLSINSSRTRLNIKSV